MRGKMSQLNRLEKFKSIYSEHFKLNNYRNSKIDFVFSYINEKFLSQFRSEEDKHEFNFFKKSFPLVLYKILRISKPDHLIRLRDLDALASYLWPKSQFDKILAESIVALYCFNLIDVVYHDGCESPYDDISIKIKEDRSQ